MISVEVVVFFLLAQKETKSPKSYNMNFEEISFNEMPKALAHLISKVETLEQLLKSQQNPALPSDKPLTISQAAEFVNLTVPTLYGFVSKRTIPFSKLGKRLYFSEAELTSWIKSGRKQSVTNLPGQPAVLVINKKSTR